MSNDLLIPAHLTPRHFFRGVVGHQRNQLFSINWLGGVIVAAGVDTFVIDHTNLGVSTLTHEFQKILTRRKKPRNVLREWKCE